MLGTSITRILDSVLSERPLEALAHLPRREQYAVLLTLGLDERIPQPGVKAAFEALTDDEQRIVLRYRDRPPPCRPKGARRVSFDDLLARAGRERDEH